MPNLSVSHAREVLSETVNRVHYQGERVILERRGNPVEAIVSIEDLKRLEELEEPTLGPGGQFRPAEGRQPAWRGAEHL